jgi:hypothetical protein
VILLGRVIIGDVAATLVDLAIRWLLEVQEPAGDGTDWLLSPLESSAPGHRRESLLGYERTLLRGLSSGGSAVTVSALAPRIAGVLADTRREVVRDAVTRGWLRRMHHDQRTSEGQRLAARIRVFQRHLRQYASDQGESALAGPLLPYAMHFGMTCQQDLPLVRLAQHWVVRFSALPGWHAAVPRAPNPLDDPVPLDNRWSGYARF